MRLLVIRKLQASKLLTPMVIFLFHINGLLFIEHDWIKADTHGGFCSRSMLQAYFARVSTHEGAFSSSLNLPWELAPKYLTCQISWSILRGGNSAPEDEVYPWNRWYTRRSFAPGACPWSMLREQNPSCVSAFSTSCITVHALLVSRFTVSMYPANTDVSPRSPSLAPYHSQACI